jgi:dCMP deaminase
MRYLKGQEKREARRYLDLCTEYAKMSPCLKSQRGVAIVLNGEVIGKGCNAPPFGENPCNYCLREKVKELGLEIKTEPCRAVHAEQNAIINAYTKGYSLEGSRMYHIKVKDGKGVPSGKPSCTICSKLVVEAGIKEFVLLHEEGVAAYGAYEFNELSLESVLKGEK